MKILFLTNSLRMGGIETNLVLLAQAFSERGHQVDAATSGGVLVDAFRAAGGQHHAIPMPLSPRKFSVGAKRLADLVVSDRPDIIHAFSAPAAATSLAANSLLRLRRERKVPVVSSVMGLNSSPHERPWKTRARAWMTSLGAQKVIVIAPAIARVLESTPVSKSRLLPLPVVGVEAPVYPTADAVAQVRQQLNVGSDQMILTVGNLEPRKSHELFISAASLIADQRSDVRFFIVGEGYLRSRLEGQIADSAHADRIILLGERQDAQALIGAADIYVRPGIVEGFIGITVLEAQARGVPVISFETDDVKLALEDGVTGRLVGRGDVPALVRAITELLDDSVARARLGETGRQHVTKHYSMGSVVTGLEALYRQIVAESASTQSR